MIANTQTQGRGRQGHGWLTPAGTALAVSVILKPQAESLMRLSMLGALAVLDLVRQVGVDDVGIKWPNDVLVQGRKVAGVLPEAEWDGQRLVGAVLGIGVNVRVDFQGAPFAAINLEEAARRSLKRADLLKTLLARVDFWYARLNSPQLFETWQAGLLTLGQAVRVGEVAGMAESVDAQGALLLRDDGGALRRIVAGDLEAGY